MKKCILLFIIAKLFLPSLMIAQVIEWQNTIGGNFSDELRSIKQTTDGGYVLGGFSDSDISFDKTENCLGNYDYWIAKTNGSGVIQWQNTIGGSDFEDLFYIQQTTDGGYILGGYSSSSISGDKSEVCIGMTDFWLVKTDSSGILQWQNTIGGSEDDILWSVKQTSDGGYILGGNSNSSVSGDKTENSNGGYDYWMIKTDSSGVIQWQNTIGGNADDYGKYILQTSDGGYALAGWSKSNISGDKTENSNGLNDIWFVKTDSAGSIQWQNTIGGNKDDLVFSIHQTNDSGYILGGSSNSNISGDKTENSNGLNDYWIVKTDSTGIIQWQNTIGGSDQEGTYGHIQQTADGGYILGGSSKSDISADKTENSLGNYDYWIIKTDSVGNVQWENTIGGSTYDELLEIDQTANGGYILGGRSNSNTTGDKTEDAMGNYDYWIVKISGQYNLISGKVFIDNNSNSTQDAGELSVSNKKITENNTGRFSFSGQLGNYYFSVIDSGTFSVSPATLNYYTAVPSTHGAIFTGIQQTDSLNDFAFQPAGVFNDLCVTITPFGPFRAGFNANYQINFENVGTTTLSPTLIFFPDNDITLVSSLPLATTITTDSLVWNFGPLAPFQQGNILIIVNVNIGTPIGSLINSSVRIEPIAGDANTICNQSYWEDYTTGSYDPNDILVDQDTLLSTQFPNPPYLEYIIRFQNTGNDTAFTAKVLNPIDTTLLDLSSFEFVTASHPVNLNWITWERNMQFQFDNILLPDSNVNEPASHGFIRYRIKPKSTLVAGDSITNNAAIYFDFNAPVITNTALTRIVLPTSISESIASFDNLLLYPNPANSILYIESEINNTSESRITITDVTGRIIFSKPIASSSTKNSIDISSLSKGIYFVQHQAGDKISRGRFVKE